MLDKLATRLVINSEASGLWISNLDEVTLRAFSYAKLGIINSDRRFFIPDPTIASQFAQFFHDFPDDGVNTLLDWALVHRIVAPELVCAALGQPGLISRQLLHMALITLTANVERLIAEES